MPHRNHPHHHNPIFIFFHSQILSLQTKLPWLIALWKSKLNTVKVIFGKVFLICSIAFFFIYLYKVSINDSNLPYEHHQSLPQRFWFPKTQKPDKKKCFGKNWTNLTKYVISAIPWMTNELTKLRDIKCNTHRKQLYREVQESKNKAYFADMFFLLGCIFQSNFRIFHFSQT